MNGLWQKNTSEIKQSFLTVFFLLSLSVAQTFTQSMPTATLTPTIPNSWVQFRYNHDNTGFNQYLDNPFFQQKRQRFLDVSKIYNLILLELKKL